MLNQVVLVGRLTKELELKESEEDKKYTKINLAVGRSYKNANGEYETDFIDCVLFNNIAENTCQWCHKGDIVGVKGRLQTREIEKEDGTKFYKLEVIAEKVTFLSSKSKQINEEMEKGEE